MEIYFVTFQTQEIFPSCNNWHKLLYQLSLSHQFSISIVENIHHPRFELIASLFLQPSAAGNKHVDQLFQIANGLVELNSQLNSFVGASLRFLKTLSDPLVAKSSNWITYDGASTMEPHADSAKWIIFDKPYAVTHEQVSNFRINVVNWMNEWMNE